MRNLLALMALICLTVAIAGWYLNWYHITTAPADNGHSKLNIDFNTSKIAADTQKGVQSGAAWVNNLLDSAKQTSATESKDEKKVESATPASAEAPKPKS